MSKSKDLYERYLEVLSHIRCSLIERALPWFDKDAGSIPAKITMPSRSDVLFSKMGATFSNKNS